MRATGRSAASTGSVARWTIASAAIAVSDSSGAVATSCSVPSSFIGDPARRCSRVIQSHRFAHVAHGVLRELARALAAVRHDVAHERRIIEVTLRTLANRLLLANDRLDHRLLAVEAPH